jgi:cysteine-rich repeat protein
MAPLASAAAPEEARSAQLGLVFRPFGRTREANLATNQSGTTHHVDLEWRFHDVELTQHVVNGSLQVKFEVSTDGGLEMGGWNIDDFCIVGYDPPVCGNGAVEAGEECDDGNLFDGDGCSATCTAETGSGGSAGSGGAGAVGGSAGSGGVAGGVGGTGALGGTGGFGGGSGGFGGGSAAAPGAAPKNDEADASEGCGCRGARRAAPPGRGWLAALLGAGLLRLRRRPRAC